MRKNSSSKIPYTNFCEDPEIIQKALRIKPDDIVLSITSSGCNVLNLLLSNPKKIISLDANPYQNYLLELKIRGIQNLDHIDFLKLMGTIPSNKRLEIFNSIKNKLNRDTRLFWDSQTHLIKKGITYDKIHFSKMFRKYMIFLKGKKIIENFFKCETLEGQKNYFYKNIDGFPWRLFQKSLGNTNLYIIKLCINDVLENIFRKKNIVTENIIVNKTRREGFKIFFRYMQKLYHLKDRVKKAEYIFTNIPIKNNYFASLMLLGYYFNDDCFPPYLKKTSFPVLKRKVDRIEIQTSTLQNFLKKQQDGSISKFNLSNILDWMDYKEFKEQLYEISRIGKNQAKLCYFSTRIDRDMPKDIEKIKSEKRLANLLLNEGRTLLYGTFEIGEICK